MDRKESILLFLKARGRASLSEVADHLSLSKQGALRHLEALKARGEVSAAVEVRSGMPGRPEHVYQLTAAAAGHFPQAHRELAAELAGFLGSEQLARFFEQRARRMETEYAGRLAGLSLEGKVREVARIATEGGHMTDVQAQPDGALAIRHCNCPIQDLAARTGHPCRHELELYRRLLGTAVKRTSWMGDAETSCTYEIETKS